MRNRIPFVVAAALAASLASAPVARAQVVSHVKVVSDRVEDVSSLEAWSQSFVKPGMTDREKALAVWTSVVKFRQQDEPANEFLQNESHPHDPIKVFNVYGYGQCCCASAHVEALARAAGLRARGWAINAHSVPEVFYEDAWHMLDASLITYFPDAAGRLASVQDISKSVAEWLAGHPGLSGDGGALHDIARDNGWKTGPAALASCPFYDRDGMLPAGTHGWFSTMIEYARPDRNFVYEYGTDLGYEVNVQLRPGMKLIRNWSNGGLHVNKREGGTPGSLTGVPGLDDLRYSPRFGDLAPGRIGNGRLIYEAPPAALRPVRGAIDVRMPCPYPYLSGTLTCDAAVGRGGRLVASFSDNNGLDWKELNVITQPGPQRIDLADLVYRRYDYRLRFTLEGRGTRLTSLRLVHDIQHSQRALPALDAGSNTIRFSAGPDTGTIVVEGAINPEHKGKNLYFTDFHPTVTGMQKDLPLFLAGGTGEVTFPISTPGPMKRLRIGVHYRARDAGDYWDVAASFDGGRTWKPIDRLAGPVVGNSRYIVYTEVPKRATAALVRFAGRQVNTTGLFDLRLAADYAEPGSGFRPVKVTYVWEEDGKEVRDVHVARSRSETWQIACARKPEMKSLTVELAP